MFVRYEIEVIYGFSLFFFLFFFFSMSDIPVLLKDEPRLEVVMVLSAIRLHTFVVLHSSGALNDSALDLALLTLFGGCKRKKTY